jgi:phosphoribosylanthranilate isomerase
MTEIKICGICNLEDAEKCVELGADYLGLIFAESPRQIQPADARQIRRKLKGAIKLVGVFKDQDPRFINDTAEVIGLDLVQLHGAETPDFCQQINHAVIKAIEIPLSNPQDKASSLPDLSAYVVHAFLFDRPKSMSKDEDWLENVVEHYADQIKQWQPFFIAGGLTPENVHMACKLQPFGVDVASGVESEPGKKDHKKLEAFFQQMQGAKSC